MTETRPALGSGFDEQVAAELRGYLAQRRIKNKDLAAMVGQTQFWIGRRLNGQTACSVGDLAAIAEALGEPLTRFLPDGRTFATASVMRTGARSSTDRASDYGSEVSHFVPLVRRVAVDRPVVIPDRRGRRFVTVAPIVAELEAA